MIQVKNSFPDFHGGICMTICYDLRFPLLCKKLAKKGAHFFSIPAAFTYTTGISLGIIEG